MPQKQKLSSFVKKLPGFDRAINKRVSNKWNTATLQTLEDAKEKAPVASGNLQGSGSLTKSSAAKISSSIIFTAPYAKKLNDVTSGITLKNPGEISYYVRGVKVTKAVKGELGFLNKAIDDNEGAFAKIVSDAVEEAWRSL